MENLESILEIKERLKIYEETLLYLKNFGNKIYPSHYRVGLCALIIIISERYIDKDRYVILYTKHFKEFYLLKKTILGQGYWWPLEDVESRIKYMEKVIEVTKKKIYESETI